MYSFVARQPIFDKNRVTVAYELLFRDGMSNRFPTNVSSEYATKRIISEQFLSTPLPALVGHHTSFINFPPELIVQGFASILPRDQVVIEILEHDTPSDELYIAVRRLYADGFKLALDDFTLDKSWDRFLPYISIIKFDIRAKSYDEITQYIRTNRHRLRDVKFLAEKVETKEEFEAYKDYGFHLFQGYFYSKPEIIKRRRLSSNDVLLFRLIAEINVGEPDFQQIEKILRNDLNLSYKIMRYAKNVLYKSRGVNMPRNPTLKDTLLYLGLYELRRFVSVACLTNIEDTKGNELYHTSLVRGMFCELVAKSSAHRTLVNDVFFCGLFSLLDVILDIEPEDLFTQIGLPETVTDALTKKEGVIYQFLLLAILYEKRSWDEARAVARELGVGEDTVVESMRQATEWADNIIS